MNNQHSSVELPAIDLPAIARCMMKKFILDLRFFDATKVARTAQFPITIRVKRTERKMNVSV